MEEGTEDAGLSVPKFLRRKRKLRRTLLKMSLGLLMSESGNVSTRAQSRRLKLVKNGEFGELSVGRWMQKDRDKL